MNFLRIAIPLALGISLIASSSRAFEMGSATQTICADGTSSPCSTQPTDMANKSVNFGYNPDTTAGKPSGLFSQTFVDYFGWQAFVALNWPIDESGKPSSTKTIVSDTSSPRVWSTFKTKDEVFGAQVGEIQESTCAVKKGNLKLFRTSKFGLSDFTEAFTPYPLIDRQGNFVLYDVRMNDSEYNYLKSNNLLTKAGQKNFGKPYAFPQGNGMNIGAIEIKTSWRIMTNKDDKQKYYTADATIIVPPTFSETGKQLCIETTVGLVGMHIMQKFTNPTQFGNFWSWATFEHVLNAPLADNAPLAPVNGKSPLNNTLTPPSCNKAPISSETTPYSFYNSKCNNNAVNCSVNTPPVSLTRKYLWSASQPYAKSYLTSGNGGQFGTQVARCFAIYDSAQSVTSAYKKQLGNSPWSNYMLVGAQWAASGSEGGGPLAQLQPFAAPVYLANTTSETYLQTGSLTNPQTVPAGSCITCHSIAADTANNKSNFSFLPNDAQ